MPADRGRASQACTACRRQKTRCYVRPGSACLRCERFHQNCSLNDIDNDKKTTINDGNGSTDARLARLEARINANSSESTTRLARLENAVNTLLDKLGERDTLLQQPHPPRTRRQQSAPLTAQDQSEESDLDTSADPAAAPVLVIRDLATDIGVKSRKVEHHAAVLDALIPPEHAPTLLKIFLEHYSRWVVFDPASSPQALLAQLRQSPLLLCACCLIAVRHTTQELATTLGPPLFEHVKNLLMTALLVVPQSLEFFQAAIVLCMWSTTVGQVPLSIDSWLLSGFALQHCLSCGLFDFITTPTSRTSSHTREQLDRWCIWNHLCLVHLHYCVGTSRKAMLSRVQIERCRAIISSDHATNYETRMVAEVFLYWTVYENTSAYPVTLSNALAAVQNWKKAWGFLLDQSRSQFLQMGFHFAHLLLYDQSLKSRSARAQESLLSNMVEHASAIIQLAIDTTDDRTRHLSDHIYHMITFAAVTLCRLLHLYESRLTAFQDISSLDSLVLTLVTWLRSIGLPCHAAYTLGNVVSEFHKKLRPHAQPASPFSEHSTSWMDGMLLAGTFPGFFGMEPSPGGNNWDLLPSWGPFYQGPPT